MDEKIKNAILEFMELKEYEVFDDDYKGFMIYQDDKGTLCFAKIAWRFKSDYVPGCSFGMYSRSEYEEAMFEWEEEHKMFGDIQHDMFNVVIFGEDNAMILRIKDAPFKY